MKYSKVTLRFLLFIIVSGCATYNSTPTSIDLAINNGVVKVETKFNTVMYFDSIIYSDTNYYGMKDSNKMKLASEIISNIYLNKFDLYLTSVVLMNGEKVKGILAELNDSSITIAEYGNFNNYKAGNYSKIIIQVENIETIAFKHKDISKISFSIGSSLGATASVFLAFATGGYFGPLVLVTIPVATIPLMAIGAIRNSHYINGMNVNYKKLKLFRMRNSIKLPVL